MLGYHKTPGQRRWNLALPGTQIVNDGNFKNISNPLIAFTHNDGRLIDEDIADVPHASRMSCMHGTPQHITQETNPRAQGEQTRAAQAQEEAFQEAEVQAAQASVLARAIAEAQAAAVAAAQVAPGPQEGPPGLQPPPGGPA